MFNLIKKHKIIFVLFLILIIYLFFNNKGVFAFTYTGIDNSFFNSNDLSRAENIVGSSVWNNSDYDIILFVRDGKKGVFSFDYTKIDYSDLCDLRYICRVPSSDSCYSPLRTSTDLRVNFVSGYKGNENWFDGNYYALDYPYFTTNINNNNLKLYIIRSHFPVYNQDGSLIAEATNPIVRPPYFTLEYNEDSDSYYVYSKWYDLQNEPIAMNIHFYQINPSNELTTFNINNYDLDGWKTFQNEENYILEDDVPDDDSIDIENNNYKWREGFPLYDYGTYYFCWYSGTEHIYKISRFIFNQDGTAYKQDYNPNTNSFSSAETLENKNGVINNVFVYSPDDFSMHVVYDNYSAIIYSNYFKYDDRYNYIVDYSYDGNKYIDNMLEDMKDLDNANGGYYRFYKEVYENGTFYFRMRKFDPENSGALVLTKYCTVTVNGNFTLNENNYDYDIHHYKESHIYKFLKKNFGILFYPIDLIFNFMVRLYNIRGVEPILNIPTIREFFTGTIIINGFNFNLNTILQNETISYIYNIYLIFVDFILYVMLFNFFKTVFEEIYNKIGGML